jgi:outer membrane protein TolC
MSNYGQGEFMKKIVMALSIGSLLLFLFAAVPASLFAEEYSLEDLCRIALTRSEKLKAAQENLTISEVGKEKALSYLLPRLTATAGVTQYSEMKRTATGSVLQPESASSWGVRVDETFSMSGRELTALGISRQNVAKSQFDLTAIREDYLLRYVAAAYYNVLMARKNLEIADANLERLTKYREAAEKRLRIGEVTKTALLRAEGELSQNRTAFRRKTVSNWPWPFWRAMSESQGSSRSGKSLRLKVKSQC